MAARVLVDAGFLVALLSRGDAHHTWAVSLGHESPPPWHTCESALSEAFHLLGPRGGPVLSELLRRDVLIVSFDAATDLEPVLKLMDKYRDLPASLADAVLVRMTEALPDPVLWTTDRDFRVYRRHGRQAVPVVMPARRRGR
jgi:predicted nucleic acid-binding protein